MELWLGSCTEARLKLNDLWAESQGIVEWIFGITYLIKHLASHWKDKYKKNNPTKISDFITFIQDLMSEQFDSIKNAAIDPTKTESASGKYRFSNFKDDAIILFDNLDSVLLFLSTKYHKA